MLLEKVKGVKSWYSLCLFLEEHLDNWELKNCKGLQEKKHTCLKKGVACKVRVKDLCRCRADILLQCKLVEWIQEIKEDFVPRL